MTLFPISLLLGGLIFSFYNFGNPKGNSKQIREVITKGSLTWALGHRSWHSGEIWNSSVVNTKAVSFMALYLLKMPISITLWDILPEKKWLALGSSKHALTQILHYQIQNNTVNSLITSQQIQPTISEAPDKLYLINLLHQLEFSWEYLGLHIRTIFAFCWHFITEDNTKSGNSRSLVQQRQTPWKAPFHWLNSSNKCPTLLPY